MQLTVTYFFFCMLVHVWHQAYYEYLSCARSPWTKLWINWSGFLCATSALSVTVSALQCCYLVEIVYWTLSFSDPPCDSWWKGCQSFSQISDATESLVYYCVLLYVMFLSRACRKTEFRWAERRWSITLMLTLDSSVSSVICLNSLLRLYSYTLHCIACLLNADNNHAIIIPKNNGKNVIRALTWPLATCHCQKWIELNWVISTE